MSAIIIIIIIINLFRKAGRKINIHITHYNIIYNIYIVAVANTDVDLL